MAETTAARNPTIKATWTIQRFREIASLRDPELDRTAIVTFFRRTIRDEHPVHGRHDNSHQRIEP
jgi:hypothetical protein